MMNEVEDVSTIDQILIQDENEKMKSTDVSDDSATPQFVDDDEFHTVHEALGGEAEKTEDSLNDTLETQPIQQQQEITEHIVYNQQPSPKQQQQVPLVRKLSISSKSSPRPKKNVHTSQQERIYKVLTSEHFPANYEVCDDPAYFKSVSYAPNNYTFAIDGSQEAPPPATKGRDGSRGMDSSEGMKGGKGENGGDAQDAQDGTDGSRGDDGKHGLDAIPIHVSVTGDENELQIDGSYKGVVNMDDIINTNDNPRTLWINGKGGPGGDAGSGGKGGDGGNGGNGGAGGECENSSNSEVIGGRGGNGGSGGRGADGGNGGNAGNGGRGSNVLIETTKSELLMLVEVDVSGGPPGKPGTGGKPGRGGKGGKAGDGFLTYDDRCKGVDGKIGTSGKSGEDGRPGKHGSVGSIYYVILAPDQKTVIEKGYKKYTVKVLDYTIEGCVDDGVFEPGEELIIKDISLRNDGHLTLPAGCKLFLQETETFEPIESDHLLPAIAPGEEITTNFNLRGRIKPISQPTRSGRYSGIVEIATYCELLNKRFRDSEQKKQIDITYPIQLGRFSVPNAMVPNDAATFKLEIANISNMYYGIKSDSKQSIKYTVIFDKNFEIIGQPEPRISGTIEKLAPRSTKSIEFKAKLMNGASYYQQLKWRVELEFRDQLIEFTDLGLRVCPKFDVQEASKADVLCITHSKITQREYLMYDKIYNGLGLKAAYFDSEMYHGISKNSQTGRPNEWLGKFVGKSIILPLKDQTDLQLLYGSDIISHFHGSLVNEKEDKNDSGLVIIGVAKNVTQFKEGLKQQLYDSMANAGTFEIAEAKLSDYFVVNSPTPELMTQRLEKIVQEFTAEQPSCVFAGFKTEYAPKKLNYFNLYTYGKAVIKQLPLSKVHRLLIVTHGNETLSHNPSFLTAGFAKVIQVEPAQADSTFMTELERKEFHTDEKFFQVMLSILSSLSVEKKLQMLMEDYQERMTAITKGWEFVLDDRKDSAENNSLKKITIKELIMVSLYNDLKTEYFYHDQGLGRTRRFCQYVKNNAHKFSTMSDALYRVWLIMSRLTSHTYWRSLPYLSSLTEKRNTLISLREDLGKALFSHQDIFSATSNAEMAKQKAERDAESKDRLKMEELQKIVVSPFL